VEEEDHMTRRISDWATDVVGRGGEDTGISEQDPARRIQQAVAGGSYDGGELAAGPQRSHRSDEAAVKFLKRQVGSEEECQIGTM
jgi:hypothetical protein